ncbi:MAG: asparagine synthase (glutamine-hydrolyzing) [Candidatus Acidiferrales bacterium]
MCGIVAMFSGQRPVDAEALDKGLKTLRHRGPDGQRRWVAVDGRVGLGHARLSIIDLTTGDQPIANEDERLRIVVNGEFYEYESIQKELQEIGHDFRTQSDSEIALHLYEDLGVHCLQRLRGEFAFVLWDSRNRTIFAARDRFGIKPLFYAFHDQTLYLASEVKALFAMGVPARWNKDSLYHCLELGGQQSSTLFGGVFQVPPGYFLIATESRMQLSRYWDFDYPLISENPPRNDSEYAEEFRCALDEAVRIRLRADVPVGCYLSGGIDSCAILGLAARHHARPIRAFTLTFDLPEYNEGDIAREMAAKVGAEFVPIPVRQDEIADHFADAVLQSENLCVNAHGAAKYLLSRAVSKSGYKVVLTGEGSDEILGGYMHFGRDNIRRNGDTRLPNDSSTTRPQRSNAAGDRVHAHGLEAIQSLLGFIPAWIQTSAAQSANVFAVFADDFLESFKEVQGFRSFFNDIDVGGQLAGRDRLNQSLYLWAKTRLPNYILTILGDRMEMAHSVEGRVPFLDHQLVKLVTRQPATQKIRGAIQKYVLRESVRDLVTPAVYPRPKHAFQTPSVISNSKGKLSVLVQETLRGPLLESIPFFDRKKVLNLLDVLYRGDADSGTANDQVLMIASSACFLQAGFRLSA